MLPEHKAKLSKILDDSIEHGLYAALNRFETYDIEGDERSFAQIKKQAKEGLIAKLDEKLGELPSPTEPRLENLKHELRSIPRTISSSRLMETVEDSINECLEYIDNTEGLKKLLPIYLANTLSKRGAGMHEINSIIENIRTLKNHNFEHNAIIDGICDELNTVGRTDIGDSRVTTLKTALAEKDEALKTQINLNSALETAKRSLEEERDFLKKKVRSLEDGVKKTDVRINRLAGFESTKQVVTESQKWVEAKFKVNLATLKELKQEQGGRIEEEDKLFFSDVEKYPLHFVLKRALNFVKDLYPIEPNENPEIFYDSLRSWFDRLRRLTQRPELNKSYRAEIKDIEEFKNLFGPEYFVSVCNFAKNNLNNTESYLNMLDNLENRLKSLSLGQSEKGDLKSIGSDFRTFFEKRSGKTNSELYIAVLLLKVVSDLYTNK